jgi:hypothetical protein
VGWLFQSPVFFMGFTLLTTHHIDDLQKLMNSST